MRTFLATTAALLVLSALTVGIVDPGHRYLRPVPPPAAPLAVGEARRVPIQHDERQEKRAFALLNPRADVVVFGSSRAMTVKTSMLAPGTKLLNLAVSGGTLDDDLGLYQSLVEADHVPHVALVYLDAWVFNEHREQERWISIRDERDRFLAGVGKLPMTERARSWSDWVSGRAAEASELVAYPTLRAAVQQLVQHRGLPSVKGRIVPVGELTLEDDAVLWDGSFFSHERFRAPPPEVVEQLGRAFATGAAVYSLTPWKVDDTAVDRLAAWLSALRERGVRPLLVLPPYQTHAYDLLMASPVYGPILARYRQLAQATGVAVCDRVDPRSVPCLPSEFIDGMHTTDVCEQRLVTSCLRASPQLSPLAKQ